MLFSQYLIPTLKENPVEAQIVSHRLMLRAGMISQLSAGIYNWLPLGVRVLQKVSSIVRDELNRAGCIEILMPTLQPAELWKESNRYDAYGDEMLRITDRCGREYAYGPTAEEVVTDIFRKYVRSYKDLPKNLYNIQWKFRDETRPRFGLMRGREFLMKDAYSFDLDYESSKKSYYKMFTAYLNIFTRMGLKTIPMQADTGPIGGNLSHEFIVLAETGESQVYCHKDFLTMEAPIGIDYNSDLLPVYEKWTKPYAATEDVYDAEKVKSDDIVTARGIEVGQVFYLGKKYSVPMKAEVIDEKASPVAVEMGCYGIGISRVIPAIIEASHDDGGIVWPESVAPFKVSVINLSQGTEATDKLSEKAYEMLNNAGVEVLYDDRDERAGVKFNDNDLIGIPYQIIVGRKSAEQGMVEFKIRKTGEKIQLSLDDAVARVVNK